MLENLSYLFPYALIALMIAVPLLVLYRATRRDTAYRFVMVEDDGSVREVTHDERTYLETPCDPRDSAGPYVKPHYDYRTPDDRIGGFLLRANVPAHLTIESAPDQRRSTR